ncbi:glycosyltransferase family A protein [Mycoplasmopsis alligatoris]|uniref:Glycosyltransferase, group 2 family protein n=1 Tax=Mycoplasmopsis alligatoris A21JP2 TaxID=747682 RepID=D4XX04_9BACT|nr:glycosyltransferase family A protein [Mycoplasmopsis alligatoris]EFF41228.1 glycosyltransferase, group 2 family protein [Mycoplasmopsis alligatoris A21JP2]
MKLSIISTLNKDTRDVKTFLRDLYDQENKDFEVIMAINKPPKSKEIIEIIVEYQKKFGTRLKFFVNSKRQSNQSNFASAFNMVKGEYVYITNSDTTIRKHYTEKIIKMISNFPEADIIEFKPRLIGSIRWKPSSRIDENKLIDLNESTEPLAYTYPFIFNKIYKSSVTKKFIKFKPTFSNDSKISLELTYSLLLEAKKYVYVDERIQREYFDIETWINPLNFVASLKALEVTCTNDKRKIMQEFYYFKAYTLQVFLAGLLTGTTIFSFYTMINRKEKTQKRNNRLVEGLDQILEKMWLTNEFKNFRDSNMYMLKNLPEVNVLRRKTPINKWYKILGLLEQ